MQKNKFTAYLLYAIGEIVLVVIGILIAVRINDWNEQKRQVNQEDLYLARLIAENQQDIITFANFRKEAEKSIATIDAFCGSLKDANSSDSLILASVKEYMIYGSLVPNFSSSRSTFDDLSNTGNLKVISNPQLRNRIVEHYAEIQKVQERMKINSDWALALDTKFYSEYEGMKFVPWTAHLFPDQSPVELATELRINKDAYINNASAGYWVDRDALALIGDLNNKTEELMAQMQAALDAK